MVPTFAVYFGVMKILVAIATEILKIAILCELSCHGNQIECVHHDHSTHNI